MPFHEPEIDVDKSSGGLTGFLEDLLMLAVVVAFVAAITVFSQDIAALALALQGRA